MVCALTGLLLLSLLSNGVKGVEIDLNVLRKIISYIETRYHPCNTGSPVQYAVAIRISPTYCTTDNWQEIRDLPDGDAVREKLDNQDKADRLYVESVHLVAARPKGSGHSAKHSERLLLNNNISEHRQQTPMEHLMNNHIDDCVVFYTLNSPCMDDCLNKTRYDATRALSEKDKTKNVNDLSLYKYIIPALQKRFEHHRGPAAFVFNTIYRGDQNKEVGQRQKAMMPLAEQVPLYRCQENQACIKCGDRNSHQLDSNC